MWSQDYMSLGESGQANPLFSSPNLKKKSVPKIEFAKSPVKEVSYFFKLFNNRVIHISFVEKLISKLQVIHTFAASTKKSGVIFLLKQLAASSRIVKEAIRLFGPKRTLSKLGEMCIKAVATLSLDRNLK